MNNEDEEHSKYIQVLTFLYSNVWEIFVGANAEQVMLNSSFFFHSFVVGKVFLFVMRTSLPYFGVKLSCVCLMFAYRKK